MRKDLRIKEYGVNENGTIIFFLGKYKNHLYYHSILQSLSERGFLILAIPFELKNKRVHRDLDRAIEHLNINFQSIILMSHAQGDRRLYWFLKTTRFEVSKLIICAPTRRTIHSQELKTLVLWSDGYRRSVPLDIFRFVSNRKDYKFIGYPNTSRYLFAGVGYSTLHDRFDKNPKRVFFDINKYTHIEKEVIDDIVLYIKEDRVREKLAIFCENYLPFNSGVNILTNVLKTELEKKDIKVYPVTFKLKGVNYRREEQEKNVIVFPCFYLPGKKAQKEALCLSFNFAHRMINLRAYQFDYIQLQTEFTMGITGMLLRKKDNIPLMYTAHTMWNDMMEKRYPKPIAKFVNGFINKFLLVPPLKYADIMTVPTEKVKTYYMEKWHKKEPIVVIPGCVDGGRFVLNEEDKETLNKLKETYRLNDKVVLGFIGRVSKEKSIDQVVDYFEKLAPEINNLVLMIVGDGPYLDNMFLRVRKSKYGDRIIMVGGVRNDTLKYYYRLFDCFCTASTFETQGLTYVESMWCHTPILAREDHCLDHFLTNGVNGLTFTDYESWKEGLLRIINDKEYVKSLTDEGYQTALTYSKDVWAKRMYYLYTQAKLFNEGKITEINYTEFKNIK